MFLSTILHMVEEEEEIFQINDYTNSTEFEELTSAIELNLRQSGLSVDIRQGTALPQSQTFEFHGYTFSCHHIINKGGKEAVREGLDLPCVVDMWADSPDYYPFSGHTLTQLFALKEFLVIRGKIPKAQEKTVLSAFAVATHTAKCALPVFITRHEEQDGASLVVQGVLSFPGYSGHFEVWNLGTEWEINKKMSFASGYGTLLDFFSTRLGGFTKAVTATAYTAYRQIKPSHDRSPLCHDIICELNVFCKWPTGPAELLLSCLRANELVPKLCETFRIEVIEEVRQQPVSDFVLQLQSQLDLPEKDNRARDPVCEDLVESVFFDEFLIMLDELFPMFPINSLWTKLAIGLLDEGIFSVHMVKAYIESIRVVAESCKLKVSPNADFKHFARCSALHQHLLIILAGMQCLSLLKSAAMVDVNSRCVFLHMSPSRVLEQQLMDPAGLTIYKEQLTTRALKAFLVDKFTQTGQIPSISDFIDWHKTCLKDFPFYNFLCSEMDDGNMMDWWQRVASKSFTETHAFLRSELLKEVEMSIQALEEINIEEVGAYLSGLCVSAVISKVFRQQVAFLNVSKADPFAIPSIKELIRPAFRVFRRNCRHLPNLRDMDSVIVEELRTSLTKLEASISKAFSLTIKFSESKGLVAKLMETAQIDISDGPERAEVLEYVVNSRSLWKTHTVLHTDKAKLSCVIQGHEAHLAIARINRERPID